MEDWRDITPTSPSNDIRVWTRIYDEQDGERNVQIMTRRGRLWFTGEGKSEMYVYYTPTHWKFIR